MTSLAFSILDARPARDSAAPAIAFRVRIASASGPVHAIALRCQLLIDAPDRAYAPAERERLYELFGEPGQWRRTLRAVTWGHSSTVVRAFEKDVEVELPVACTYDLVIAASKYLYAVRDGEVPLSFQFSGTTFAVRDNALAIEPVPWDREASFRMPARVWHEAMDRFFPGSGWIRLQRETLDRLQAFRGRQALVEWDDVVNRLLQQAGMEAPL